MVQGFDLNKGRRDGDAAKKGGRPTDLVILVIGPVGAGKSTFLRNVLKSLNYGGPMPDVHDGFESCTRDVTPYMVPLPSPTPAMGGQYGQRLVLVDTPGFNDIYASESEVLRRIGIWLASFYDSRMKVGGVIYLFPISPNKITSSDKANLDLIRQLCGNHMVAKARMVTTKWSLCPREVGENRESQLRTNFWKEMIDGGSGVSRLDDSPESAKSVLDEVLERYKTAPRVLLHDSPESASSDPTEDIILVLGNAGVGKSRFINDLVGDTWAVEKDEYVGNPSIAHYNISRGTGRLTTFVDCPGYGETNRSDSDINSMIRTFLTQPAFHRPGSRVTGIIYLIDLSYRGQSSAWKSILSNAKLTCPKLLAVTCSKSKNPDALAAAVASFQSLPEVKTIMVSNGVLCAQYEYDSKNFALDLLQRISSPLIDPFLNEILPQ